MQIPKDNGNTFLAVAAAEWNNGADGEGLARNLVAAFRVVVIEGCGPDQDVTAEFTRLLAELD